jgi:hypothetical protein
MAHRDPIGLIPKSASVHHALERARNRVDALEYLLTVATEMETRLKQRSSKKWSSRKKRTSTSPRSQSKRKQGEGS